MADSRPLLLEVEHLCKWFPLKRTAGDVLQRKEKRYLKAVNDVSFQLFKGENLGLVGESGCGKSTLARTILRLYEPTSGTILLNGTDISHMKGDALRRLRPQMQMIFQDPYSSLNPRMSVYDTIAEMLRVHKVVPAEELPARVEQLLTMSGLTMDIAERFPGEFSGGQRQRIGIARALSLNPAFIVADEPVSALDVSIQAQIINLLAQLQRELELTVLFISHDEVLLENTANVIIHMEQLRRKTLPRWTVARMGYRQYVEERLQKFAHQEQMAKKEREEERKQQERFQKIQQKVEHQLNAISRQDPHGGRLLKKKMKAVKSLEHRFDREREDMTEFPDSEEAILVGFGENTAIPAGKTVLDFTLPALYAGEASQGQPPLAENLRLYVRGGEHVCILGPNGAGKTTLLRQIAGELLKRGDIRAAYMPQDYGETVNQDLTPVEFLAKSWEKAELTKVKTYLGSMKYTAEEQGHAVRELSGGQKAKLFFLKMILDGCNVLVLDEPTRNFSPLSGPVIRGILEDFPGCIISVSHDRKYIGQVCSTLYRLEPSGLAPMENLWRERP